MNAPTLGQRLRGALEARGLSPAKVAALAGTTESTVSNWLNDQVQPENVKAAMLFAIADATGADPRFLLTGDADFVLQHGGNVTVIETKRQTESSQPVQLDDWKIAFQLVAEALGNELTLPPDKQAEVTLLTHDLLVEGMPRAKVLRFVRAAAA